MKQPQGALAGVAQPAHRHPRKSYVDGTTLSLISERKNLRRDLTRFGREYRKSALAVLFHGWAALLEAYHSVPTFDPASACNLDRTVALFHHTAAAIKLRLRAAQTEHISTLATKIRQGCIDRNPRAVFHALKPFRANKGGGQAAKTRPTIPGPDGHPPKDKDSQNAIWEAHFVQSKRANSVLQKTSSRHPLKLDIPGFAQASFPLAVKCAATLREPLRWKGPPPAQTAFAASLSLRPLAKGFMPGSGRPCYHALRPPASRLMPVLQAGLLHRL